MEEPKLDGAMTKIVAKKKTSSKKGGGFGKGRAKTRDRESNKGGGGGASAKTMRTFNQLLEANALDEAPVGNTDVHDHRGWTAEQRRASKVLLGVRVPESVHVFSMRDAVLL